MQYRLRVLFILLAVVPPAFGIAALSVLRNPAFAVVVLAWTIAFVIACVAGAKTAHMGLTIAEWLVVAGILLVLASLAMPVLVAERV